MCRLCHSTELVTMVHAVSVCVPFILLRCCAHHRWWWAGVWAFSWSVLWSRDIWSKVVKSLPTVHMLCGHCCCSQSHHRVEQPWPTLINPQHTSTVLTIPKKPQHQSSTLPSPHGSFTNPQHPSTTLKPPTVHTSSTPQGDPTQFLTTLNNSYISTTPRRTPADPQQLSAPSHRFRCSEAGGHYWWFTAKGDWL